MLTSIFCLQVISPQNGIIIARIIHYDHVYFCFTAFSQSKIWIFKTLNKLQLYFFLVINDLLRNKLTSNTKRKEVYDMVLFLWLKWAYFAKKHQKIKIDHTFQYMLQLQNFRSKFYRSNNNAISRETWRVQWKANFSIWSSSSSRSLKFRLAS